MSFPKAISLGAALAATYTQVLAEQLMTDQADDLSGLESSLTTVNFRVNAGERELYRDFNGDWRRWDRATMTWV